MSGFGTASRLAGPVHASWRQQACQIRVDLLVQGIVVRRARPSIPERECRMNPMCILTIALRLPHMASWGGSVVRLADGAGRNQH